MNGLLKDRFVRWGLGAHAAAVLSGLVAIVTQRASLAALTGVLGFAAGLSMAAIVLLPWRRARAAAGSAHL